MKKLAPLAAVAGALALVAVAFVSVFHHRASPSDISRPAVVATTAPVVASLPPAVPSKPAPALVDTKPGWKLVIERLKRPAFLQKATPVPAKVDVMPVPRPAEARRPTVKRRHHRPAPKVIQKLPDAAYGAVPWNLDAFIKKLIYG